MARPMRADAARNRARVLEVAYEAFASEGLSVPIDEIARRAGVGAGTVYRHFPTKEDLFRAVVVDRFGGIVAQGRELLESEPAEGLFAFLRSMVLQWGATDRGLVDAFAGVELDIGDVESDFLDVLAGLLAAGQAAGTVRIDVTVAEIKAMLVGLQAMQAYSADAAVRGTEVVIDGLRAP